MNNKLLLKQAIEQSFTIAAYHCSSFVIDLPDFNAHLVDIITSLDGGLKITVYDGLSRDAGITADFDFDSRNKSLRIYSARTDETASYIAEWFKEQYENRLHEVSITEEVKDSLSGLV